MWVPVCGLPRLEASTPPLSGTVFLAVQVGTPPPLFAGPCLGAVAL